MENQTPLYTHDCEKCTFLGIHENSDLYYCDAGNTVISRNSSEAPDYSSGMSFVGLIPDLTEAHKRAVERGLIAG